MKEQAQMAVITSSDRLAWFATVEPWQWLVLAVLLLIAETLGTGGFLIGIAIACLVQSAISFIWPDISWAVQFVLFAFNAIFFTVLYWRVFRRFNQKTDHSDINNRAAQLIGQRVVITDDFPAGEGKLIIGDTFWRFRCSDALASGDTVEVKSSEGMLLMVEKA